MFVDLSSYGVFLMLVLAVTFSPGPAILLAVYNSITYGFRVACIGILGNLTAMMIMATISGLGLGAIILASATLFTLVKWIGGAYLIYLGIKALRQRGQTCDAGQNVETLKGRSATAWMIWCQAFMTGISNPKALAFYVALFPQFIDHSQPLWLEMLPLMAIFATGSISALMIYAGLARHARRWLQKPRVAAGFQKMMGSLFVMIGGAMLISSR